MQCCRLEPYDTAAPPNITQQPVVECETAQSLSEYATSFDPPPALNSMPSSAVWAMYASTRFACSSISGVGK
eukprot:2443086-Pleurochrysis_carterae.AAC.1